MIFVTVGTHEQPFNRLIKAIDELVENKVIHEDVIIQTGYSTYLPKKCECEKFLPYQMMKQYVTEARIVVTHGGPSSFILPLQIGKIPVVVPRQAKYNEHVNDHQLNFAHEVAERKKNIIVVDDVADLGNTILHYDSLVSGMSKKLNNHNQVFNDQLTKIIESIL